MRVYTTIILVFQIISFALLIPIYFTFRDYSYPNNIIYPLIIFLILVLSFIITIILLRIISGNENKVPYVIIHKDSQVIFISIHKLEINFPDVIDILIKPEPFLIRPIAITYNLILKRHNEDARIKWGLSYELAEEARDLIISLIK